MKVMIEMKKSTKATRKRRRIKRVTYTVQEAGEKLGIGKNSAYAAARTGQIPTIRIGYRLLVPVAAFHRLLG
jgi:excisionase family DNA binding protein